MESKELKKLKRQYNKICDKLEYLNQEAFEFEKEISYQQRKEGII